MNNKVEIFGKIRSIEDYGKIVGVNLKTENKTIFGEIKTDYPTVIFQGEVAQKLRNAYKVGYFVHITGKLITRAVLVNEKRIYLQKIYATDIEEMVAVSDDYKNLVVLEGTVSSIYKTDKKMLTIVSLAVQNFIEGENKIEGIKDVSFPAILTYSNIADFANTQLDEDDHVRVTGIIETKVENDEDAYFMDYKETIVCTGIEILD